MECDTVGVFGVDEQMANFEVSVNFTALFSRCEYTRCGPYLVLAEV